MLIDVIVQDFNNFECETGFGALLQQYGFKEYVQKHVFRISDEEIESMKDSIDSEPPPPDIDADDDEGGDDDKGPPQPPGDEEEPEEEQIQIDSIERR